MKAKELDPNVALSDYYLDFFNRMGAIDKIYNEGKDYLAKKDYDNAYKKFTDCLRYDSNHTGAKQGINDIAEIYLQIGNTYFSKNDYDNAVAQYIKVQDLYTDPAIKERARQGIKNVAELYFQKGNAYLSNNDYDNAIVQIETCLPEKYLSPKASAYQS